MTVPQGMTISQYAERRVMRQRLFDSDFGKSGALFTHAEATKLLNSFPEARQMDKSSTQAFLRQMVLDGLLRPIKPKPGLLFYTTLVKPSQIVAGSWMVTDNGIRIGLHQPPSRAA